MDPAEPGHAPCKGGQGTQNLSSTHLGNTATHVLIWISTGGDILAINRLFPPGLLQSSTGKPRKTYLEGYPSTQTGLLTWQFPYSLCNDAIIQHLYPPYGHKTPQL